MEIVPHTACLLGVGWLGALVGHQMSQRDVETVPAWRVHHLERAARAGALPARQLRALEDWLRERYGPNYRPVFAEPRGSVQEMALEGTVQEKPGRGIRL